MKNTKHKIILIANSDHAFDINQHITDQDIIVRFNYPKPSTLETTGQRTDILFLANAVDIVQKKLRENSKFMRFIQNKQKNLLIVFPYSDDLIKINKPQYKKKIMLFFRKLTDNFNNSYYLNFLISRGYQVKVMPEQYYFDLKTKIQYESKNILSTGVLATYFFLHHPQYQNYKIYLHGFSFEGWDGHDWDKEKKYIHSLIQMGSIHTFPKTT